MAEPRTFSIDEVDGFVTFLQNVSTHFHYLKDPVPYNRINFIPNYFFIDLGKKMLRRNVILRNVYLY